MPTLEQYPSFFLQMILLNEKSIDHAMFYDFHKNTFMINIQSTQQHGNCESNNHIRIYSSGA